MIRILIALYLISIGFWFIGALLIADYLFNIAVILFACTYSKCLAMGDSK